MSNSAPTSKQRAATRAKIFQPGEMHTIAGAQRVHLLDLSSSGALVYTAGDAPAAGSVVRLSAAGESLGPARVKWVSGKRFGVAFPTPLSAERIDQLLQAQRTMVKRLEDQPVLPSES